MNGSHRLVRLATFATVSALALVACGKSTNTNVSASTTAPSGTPAVSNDWALKYTGGTAGKADNAMSPIVIGYVNQEGGVPSFPESTNGIDAAVKYVNEELGGIKGHPIQLKKCTVVTAEAEGQTCGTQFANDDNIKLVITGAMSVGNAALYTVLAGKKAVLVSNPITNADSLTTGITAFTPGAAGVIKGMAAFIPKFLPNAKKIVVLHGDDQAATAAAQILFKPTATKVGLPEPTLVKVSDSASTPQVQSALQAAGVDKIDLLVPIVTAQLCNATFDALNNLGAKTTVLTTGLCYGTPMTKHLHDDLGLKDAFPNGWYFGGYGYSYFLPDDASGQTTYLDKIKKYGPKDVEFTGFAGPVFGTLLTAVKFYNTTGPDTATAANLGAAAQAFKGPMMITAGPMQCGFSKLLKSLCGTQMGVQQFKDGKWTSIADALNNMPVETKDLP